MGRLGPSRIPPPVRYIANTSLEKYLVFLTWHSSTLSVLSLVDVVFDFGYLLHPYKCDGSELLDMALPCGRNLWQASDRSEWEREYSQRGARKQLTYGDLLNSRFTPDRALDSWLEQLDDFGNLVMAAASLRDM
jgi:hypothetical protein